MNKKDRVSLEVAKQLKEAGYEQDGCDAYHEITRTTGNPSEKYKNLVNGVLKDRFAGAYHYIAAPCVGELGEALPECIPNDIGESDKWLRIEKVRTPKRTKRKGWLCAYSSYPNIYNFNLADCLALMWIELKKRGLV